MKNDKHLPSALPTVDRLLRRLVLAMLAVSLAMPVISDKPWEKAGEYFSRKVAPHIGMDKK